MFSLCSLPNIVQNYQKIWTYSSSRSSKVDDFGTNRKRIYEFQLVINSKFGPILHHFWDTASYWLKIAYFSYPSLIRHPAGPLPMLPLKFRGEVKHQETRVMGLLCGEDCMIQLQPSLTDPPVWRTDRQADGWTDRWTGDSI